MDIGFLSRYYGNRIFWFFAGPIRRSFRYFFRGQGRAVKILIHRSDKILLVRPNYGHREWTIPGGAVDGNESFEHAARRETMEELGIHLNNLATVCSYEHVHEYQNTDIGVFAASVQDDGFTIDGIEIKEAAWFSFNALPPDRRSRTDKILNEFRASTAANSLLTR